MSNSRKLQILNDLLTTAERSFEAAVKHAAIVDDKAQKTSALAGVLVGLGFIRPESLALLQQHFGSLSLVLVYVILILLVVSIVLCLRAMWLRKVPLGGLSVTAHEQSARLIMSFGDEIDDELMAAYCENQLEVWKRAIEERHEANVQKTSLVHQAQRVLALSILVAIIVLGLLGFTTLQSAIPSKQEPAMPDKKQNSTGEPKAQLKRLSGSLAKAKGAGDGESVDVDEHGNVVAVYREVPVHLSSAKLRAIQELTSPDFVTAQAAKLDRLE